MTEIGQRFQNESEALLFTDSLIHFRFKAEAQTMNLSFIGSKEDVLPHKTSARTPGTSLNLLLKHTQKPLCAQRWQETQCEDANVCP